LLEFDVAASVCSCCLVWPFGLLVPVLEAAVDELQTSHRGVCVVVDAF
jgi:hypothetical protein